MCIRDSEPPSLTIPSITDAIPKRPPLTFDQTLPSLVASAPPKPQPTITLSISHLNASQRCRAKLLLQIQKRTTVAPTIKVSHPSPPSSDDESNDNSSKPHKSRHNTDRNDHPHHPPSNTKCDDDDDTHTPSIASSTHKSNHSHNSKRPSEYTPVSYTHLTLPTILRV